MTTTWDPTNASSNIALSNGNLTASQTAFENSGVYGTTSKSSGKWYIEYNSLSFWNGNSYIGLAAAGNALNTNSVVYLGFTSSGSFDGGTFSENIAGHTIQLAVDFDNHLLWANIDNGLWQNSSTANPTTGTGGYDYHSTTTAPLFPFLMVLSTCSATINPGPSTTYTPPAGFTAWDGVIVPPPPPPLPVANFGTVIA